MKSLKSVIALLLISLCISCDSSTGPIESLEYMSLNVGDTREYFSDKDSSYLIFKISGKTKRADGKEVFIGEWNWNISLDSNKMKSYYFIRDGYFISTELDTTANEEIRKVNPFFEQRLAKIKPVDGDKWSVAEGLTDSSSGYFSASFVGRKQTPVFTLNDVFGFQLDNMLIVYYAKEFGHIGTSFIGLDSSQILLNYIKVNNKEFGKFIPFDILPKHSSSNSSHKRFNPFGEIIK